MKDAIWRAYERVAMVIGLGSLAIICLTWTPFALVLNPILPERTARRVGRRAISVGFRIYTGILTLLCACRFDLEAVERLGREPGGQVVVANHPSLLDAVLLVSRLPNAVCIMKAELVNNLFLGAGARMAGYIVNDAPLPMIRSAIRELEGGACLVVFPEGTRTAVPPVGPCASTVGLIAARARVPVQSLIIEMSSWYLGKHWGLFKPPRLPLQVRVRAAKRFDTIAAPQRFGADIEAYFRSELAGSTDVPITPRQAAN